MFLREMLQHTRDKTRGSPTPPFPRTAALAPQRCSVRAAVSSQLALAAHQRLCLRLRGATSCSSQPLFPGEAKVYRMQGVLSPQLKLCGELACTPGM